MMLQQTTVAVTAPYWERFIARFPDCFRVWLALPGSGHYTTGAIASIAGGERVPTVDANARRVRLRWL
jgi:adenine-specific DNA glycosylase